MDEIGIYTYNDTIPLSQIFTEIATKTNCGPSISHKSSKTELTNYFRDILPEYDEERVFTSDIKKLFQWYNLLHGANKLELKEKKEDKVEKKEAASKKETAAEKLPAKKK